MSGGLLLSIMRDPASAGALEGDRWNALIAAARAEQMLGNLATRLEPYERGFPAAVRAILADARGEAAHARTRALWEADRAAEALLPLGIPVVLLKGTAYAAAGLDAGAGRSIGDLDILVPRDRLDEAEAALLAAGWEWVKPDPYDDAYYRQWMHELPPLIHSERDRMIDVHHTILPLTARPRPDASAMLADAVSLPSGLKILSHEHMVIHACVHLMADGDLAGGLRNLWDIDRLCRAFAAERDDFYFALYQESARHGLFAPVARALRLAHDMYGTPVASCVAPIQVDMALRWSDRLFRARMIARDGWGRETRKLLRFAFFIRSHWLRMPPMMLARHLWTKWRKGHRPL